MIVDFMILKLEFNTFKALIKVIKVVKKNILDTISLTFKTSTLNFIKKIIV